MSVNVTGIPPHYYAYKALSFLPVYVCILLFTKFFIYCQLFLPNMHTIFLHTLKLLCVCVLFFYIYIDDLGMMTD